MDNGKKNEAKILTTNEIRKEARNWSLAGDVGLLAHLEQFSENIINRTQETQKRFTELVDDYEELYTKVGNVTNQFLALQNCQFVENRVYDEETPTEENAEVKTANEVEQEKLLLMQYKEAVEVGIKLLDTHFQEVQLPPNSDSDDSDDSDDVEVSNGASTIWKAKNPYAEKKFPLLIGSADWWADDHVGLGPEEEPLDAERVVSESEADAESLKSVEKEGTKSTSSSSMENIKRTPAKGPFLDSSSEDLFGLEKNEELKSSVSEDLFFGKSEAIAKGTDDFLPDFLEEAEKNEFSNANRPLPLAENTEEEEEEEKLAEALRPQKVDNAFTRELVAKLSSVTNKKGSAMREENGNEKANEEGSETKTEKKIGKKDEVNAREMRGTEESLFDETDDSSDLFSSKVHEKAERKEKDRKKRKSVLFEGENDDDLFERENDLFSNGKSFFESEEPEVANSHSGVEDVSVSQRPPKPSDPEKKNPAKDLFDDLDDDDDLFASKPILKSLSSLERDGTLMKTKSEATTGLSWNSDEALFDSSRSYNVAVDDDLFSSASLFGPRADSADERNKSNLALFPEEAQREEKRGNREDVDAKSFLFESKALSDDGGRGKGDGAKKVSVLGSEDEDEEGLFSEGPRDRRSALKATAFVDDDDAALFGEMARPSDAVSVSSSRSSLFDDVSASKSRLGSVFMGGGAKAEEWLGGEGRGAGERGSLFGEREEEEDLFGGDACRGAVGAGEVRKGVGSVKDFVDELEDDLFKASVVPTKLRETKSDIFRKAEKKLFADDEDDSDLFSAATSVKPKPPTSLRLKSAESEVRGKVVGKLNIPDNLKVRFESAAKRISPGGVKVPAEAEEEKKKAVESEEVEEIKKDDLLDDPPPSSNLLKCPSKDRVKIPGRRRPQSRRARQEALRASGTWDQSSPSPASTPAPASAPLSNPLSPSTDEEDFFKVPELDTNFEKEDQSIFKNDLFESSKKSAVADNLLFDAAPVLSPLGPPEASDHPRPSSIFPDDNDDNDDSLFKGTKLLLPKAEGKEKKSLFEDESDDDEDDLFGGKSVATSKNPLQVNQSDNKEKKEEKESSAFIDPLGLITND